MAFRKTVKCTYRPYINAGGFHEVKSVPVERGDGSNSHIVSSVSMSDLAKSTLPFVSLPDVLASGKPISGSVDFTPAAHSLESNVQTFLSTHLPESAESVESV